MGLIEDVAVDPKLRGKGIGKKLIKNLIKYSVKENCDKVSLSSSEKNVPFYEKIGFQVNELQMILRNN
jgi:ribosomal protein S18 acetylase RimI-like enzyme